MRIDNGVGRYTPLRVQLVFAAWTVVALAALVILAGIAAAQPPAEPPPPKEPHVQHVKLDKKSRESEAHGKGVTFHNNVEFIPSHRETVQTGGIARDRMEFETVPSYTRGYCDADGNSDKRWVYFTGDAR